MSCVDILGVKLCNRICVRDLDTCIIQIMGVTTESGLFHYVANNVVLVRFFFILLRMHAIALRPAED